MNCANPECGQVIEPGNKFCTKCGAPVRKEEERPCETQMLSTPPEKQPIKKTMHKLFLVILASIVVVAGIIFYAEIPDKKVEGIKEGVPNTGTIAPGNAVPTKSGGASSKGVESLQEEATQVCSEYARIFKECYMKASNGVSPAQAKNDIKTERLDAEMINTSCRDGFMEHGRLGDVSSSEINKMTSSMFSNCFNGFIEGGSNRIAKEHIKSAYVAAMAYFGDEPKGTLTSKKLEVYNYRPSAEVIISIINGTSDNLSISVKHTDGDVTYFINSAGDITEKK